MSLVYMIPFYINRNEEYYQKELKIIKECIESLENCQYIDLIFYNQGGFSNKELEAFLMTYKIKFKILGNGTNEGIPRARYNMLKYINEKYKSAKYIAEVHLDMIFTPTWDKPLIEYLESTDEPMIAPRIISTTTNNINTATGKKGRINFSGTLKERIAILESYREDRVEGGFVHPVIHKLEALNSINPYDVGFLTGKQGYEDDSILIGYSYYMGTKNKWKPKINFKSCVYHKVAAQRLKLSDFVPDNRKNLEGLMAQYGAYGQKELVRIHSINQYFKIYYENMILDKSAYDKKFDEHKLSHWDYLYINNLYNSRYFVYLDEFNGNVFLKTPRDWWSRLYEYSWASKFAKPEDICLDAACGVKHPFKFYLANTCKEVHAFDNDSDIIDNSKILEGVSEFFDKKDVEKAKEQIDKIHFNYSNINSLSYDDDYFDKIYCISVLHLIDDKDVTEGLKQLKRILKKDGLLILTFDIPTININKLTEKIQNIGFKIKGELNLERPNNAIYSNLSGGIYCYRMLLTK